LNRLTVQSAAAIWLNTAHLKIKKLFLYASINSSGLRSDSGLSGNGVPGSHGKL
jgi:hypothetical protein